MVLWKDKSVNTKESSCVLGIIKEGIVNRREIMPQYKYMVHFHCECYVHFYFPHFKTHRARKGTEKGNKDHHRLGIDSVQGKTTQAMQ